MGGPDSKPCKHCRRGECLAGPGKRQQGERQIAPHRSSSADFHQHFNTHPKHATRKSATPSLHALLPRVGARTAAHESTRAVQAHNLDAPPRLRPPFTCAAESPRGHLGRVRNLTAIAKAAATQMGSHYQRTGRHQAPLSLSNVAPHAHLPAGCGTGGQATYESEIRPLNEKRL